MEKRAPAKTFQDLLVWQKAHSLVLAIYRFSAGFPKEEVYGITSQLRRAVVSVPANIAEGFKKKGKSDKARYMNIAQGSLEEVRYYLILVNDLGFGCTNKHREMLDEVGRMLDAYSASILTPVS
jgi:four helix bundle protein